MYIIAAKIQIIRYNNSLVKNQLLFDYAYKNDITMCGGLFGFFQLFDHCFTTRKKFFHFFHCLPFGLG